ncbi:MAG TPA: cyclic pyranopterin monophosphate synthase MoaC [Polyangiaceae bacterium]|nr:cyclic pyranopterin monophosphate synthase MoaC [Polyangiaceae bacterium]
MDCTYGFDDADDELLFLPMAARRALDCAGLKLSLQAWRSLSSAQRWQIARAGANSAVDWKQVTELTTGAAPAPSVITVMSEPSANQPPKDLIQALGPTRPLDTDLWRARSPLDRYTLVKLQQRGRTEKLARAYDEIFQIPHRNAEGEARMVDVHRKEITYRQATASARLRMSPGTVQRLLAGDVTKGDVLAVARVAGIQAAKRTAELIPLCHTLALTRVSVDFAVNETQGEVLVRAQAEAMDRTGVEMEAMLAASTAALTLYDMVKSMDRWMTITNVQLEEKSGGKSGPLKRPSP